MKNLKFLPALFAGAAMILVTSCEGPAGPAGLDGTDANESCKTCHNPNVVDFIKSQYELSKHSRGEAAFEETGNASCAPCHESNGFKLVCKNNTPATFRFDTIAKRYVNNYAADATTAYGEFTCNTCHQNLHKAYDSTDLFPLTTIAPVPMTMWAGTKTIDLKQDHSLGNLCVKCHQPRPLTSAKDGNVLDYASFVTDPNGIAFTDSTKANKSKNFVTPGYRTHVHYGGVGAIFAGMGGVEFTGSKSYTSSKHTTAASCQECHMAEVSGSAGGHTFRAKGNFKGCNVSGCHGDAPLDATSGKFVDTRKEIKALIEALAAKLQSGGVEFLHKEADAELNLWAGLTKNNYDGYLNIYDPSTNPNGVWGNPNPGSFSKDAKTYNNTLPQFPSLKNVQLGAIINFQLCLREYSLGIHNTSYSKALLQNSIDALTAAGL